MLFHPLYHGLFHNGLDIRRAEQLALNGRSLCHPEFSIFRDKFFPCNSFLFPGTVPQRSQPGSCLLFNRIRSVVRKNTFARQIASSSPINVTLPSSTWEISYPRSMISFLIQLPVQNDRVRSVHRFASILFPHSSKFISLFCFILLFTASYYFLQLNFFYHFALQGINGKYSIFRIAYVFGFPPFRNRNRAWI